MVFNKFILEDVKVCVKEFDFLGSVFDFFEGFVG